MTDYEKVLNVLLDTLKKPSVSHSFSEVGSCATCPSGQYGDVHIPLGVSNRHAHLAQRDIDVLFGRGHQFQSIKDLAQPGQFACKETVTLVGPRGAIEKVRVLGPARSDSQVELLMADCRKIGIAGVVRMSGDLDGTPGLTLVGPKGTVVLDKGAIVAQRHIHMHTSDAQRTGYHDGQVVQVAIDSPRGGIFNNVVLRVSDSAATEFHIDVEESNALQADSKTQVHIIK